jgi:hypothetical protein
MSSARFSRIVIIQSLSPDDSPTGRHLRDAIEPTATFKRGIPVTFIDARAAREFWVALENVQEMTERAGDIPVLHLECHGLSDKAGLSLADKTPVLWTELRPTLVKLNYATQCNLFVTLAACHGAMLMETLDVRARAPCWGLMGPSDKVSPPDLVASYSSFFLELFRSENSDAALRALRDSPERSANYLLFTAEDIFEQVLQRHRSTCSTNSQIAQRAERFTQTFREMGVFSPNESTVLSLLYGTEHEILEHFFTLFFFVDHFPEHKERFADSYLAILPRKL